MKKTPLALVALFLGLILPITVQALAMSGPTRGSGSLGSAMRSSHESSEDTSEVSAVVTPRTNTGDGACNEVTHFHWHTNISTNTADRYFRAVVYSTAIQLDDDFMDNIDTSNMVCTNGNGIFVDCSFDKDSTPLGTELYNSNSDTANTDEWNGTTITYQTLSWIAGDPVGLVWRYGQDDDTDLSLLPWISPGQSKEEDLLFVPENFDHVQTATTESWTKLEFFYIDPDVYDDRDGDGDGEGTYTLSDFHEIYPGTVSSDGTTDDAGVDPDGDYIFWWGINDIEETNWEVCGLDTPVCDQLTIDPTTATLDVGDVFNNVNFTLTAEDQDGNDITADSTFQYYVNKYDAANPVGDGVFNTDADADGLLNYGLGNLFFGRSPNTSDNTVRFRSTEPGDSLYAYVSDYNGTPYQDECYVEVELPYCTELNITDPSGAFGSGWLGIFHGTSFNTNISVEAYSGTDSWEPFSITYDSTDDAATYDGAPDSYTTNDYTVDDYESNESGTVTVGLDDENGDGESDDVAGLCTDQFTYTLIPEITLPACEELTFLTTDPISAEDMEAGDVMIHWTATMDDGTMVAPPYYCESTNTAGTFSEVRGGPTTAHAINTSMTTLYYNGEPGDSIRCMSLNYPYCVDTLTSETSTGETYACSEIAMEPAYIWTAGTKIYIDETDPDSIQDLYDEGTVCYDFTVTVEDPAFDGFLTATGYESDHSTVLSSSNIEMDITETGGNITGNPATLNITGFTEYTGSICWSDYEEEGYITLEVDDQIACFEEAELPVPLPPEEEIACTDLALSPDSIVMSSSASDAGTQTLTILVTADDTSWTGTLFVTHTGSGTLYYPDGSTSTYSDGHLVMPVSGTSTSFTLTYVGGHSGDIVTASIDGEETACQDNLTLTQETSGGGGGGGGDSGSSGHGHGSSGESEDECTADINPGDDELVCGDDYEMEVCTDGEDTVTVSATDNEICYFLDGEEICEDNSVELEDDNDCYIVTVKDVCDETDISVEDEDNYTCFDTSLEGVAVGEFNKYIYTFNFSAQKNSYSDDGVFFAHDEDRAFYTLEYTPTGHENEIEFTDQMWDDGEITAEDGGTVELAKDYGDLTSGTAYNTDGRYTYTTILNYGFGDTHEEKSDALLSQLKSTYTDAGLYPSFIPYVKSNNNSDDSYLIPECQYETDGSLTEDQGICYDPNHSPADSSDPKVLIENAGEIDGDQYSIRIRYVGVVNSELDCTGKSAKADTCLTEEFQNTAHVDAYPDSSLGELEDTARLVVLCSYLLTENAGDVYLNDALTGGSDLSCIYVDENFNYTSYSNTDGLVILDDGSVGSSSSSSSTTYTSEFSGLTSSYCDDTGENNSLIGNLSSYVCEIVNSVSSLWKQSTVESTTDSRVDTATRNAETAQVAGDSSYSTWDELYAALKNTNNSSSNILYFNGDLSTAGTLTLGNIVVPSGAWTLVVENADLVISGEISYATTSSTADYKNLPSVAFIVQDGDIHFENSSEDNVGVYYTNQNFEGDTDGSTRSPVDQQLTIDGSLYGNIQPLLDDCRYVAPPTTEGGGLVVRYDSRILLNTPPALSEYVDVETEKGLN